VALAIQPDSTQDSVDVEMKRATISAGADIDDEIQKPLVCVEMQLKCEDFAYYRIGHAERDEQYC